MARQSGRPILRGLLGVGGLALVVIAGYWLLNEVVFHKPNPSAFVAIPTFNVSSGAPSRGPAASPAVGSAAPTSAADELTSTDVQLLAWKPEGSGFVHYLVVHELTNTSQRWVEIDAFDSTFDIFRPDGTVLTTSNFLYAYPRLIGPAGVAYVIEDGVQEGSTVEDVDRVEVEASYVVTAGPPTLALETSNTAVRPQSFGDGLVVTGEVTNTGTEPIENAHVGAIFFDAGGEIVGAATTNLVENVAPGETKAFETLGSNPLTEADYADYVVIGSPTL